MNKWIPFLGGAVRIDSSGGTIGWIGGGTALPPEQVEPVAVEPPDKTIGEGDDPYYLIGNWD